MKLTGILLISVFMLMACSQKRDIDKYNSLVKTELASNKRVDSIFLGMHLGMTQKDFYLHCWQMNQKGILTDGNDARGNMTVLYKLNKELKYPASMNFFPDFQDSSIWKMRVDYQPLTKKAAPCVFGAKSLT